MTENNKKIFLGIDPGLATTGWAVLEKNKQTINAVAYGVISTSAQAEFALRLNQINLEIEKLIKKYQPQIFAIEKIFFSKNTKTAIAVSHARGVMLLAAAKHNLIIKEFTPLQIKQAVAAYGRAEKTQMQKMIKLVLKLSELPQPDDAADALAVAWLAGQNIKI